VTWRLGLSLVLAALCLGAAPAQNPVLDQTADQTADQAAREELLWHHRNLGKAFYENPTTQEEAVAEFKQALDLAPDSPRERLNYGLALLKAGKVEEGEAELQKVRVLRPRSGEFAMPEKFGKVSHAPASRRSTTSCSPPIIMQ